MNTVFEFKVFESFLKVPDLDMELKFLEGIFIQENGFVVIPVISEFLQLGVFEWMLYNKNNSSSAESIAKEFNLVGGHTKAALRALEFIGWVKRDENKYNCCINKQLLFSGELNVYMQDIMWYGLKFEINILFKITIII